MINVITLSNVKKAYGGLTALDVERLVIPTGSVCVLLGENGGGKTTLIRILAGVVPADAGNVDTGGGDFFYLPQKPYAFRLPLWKSVTLNVNTGETSRRALAERLLESMGLSKLSASKECTLSGGESQRAAISRLFAKPRKLVLLDEPTTGLDAEGTVLFEKSLKVYIKQNNPTLVIATHDLGFARRIANRAVLLTAGRVFAEGAVEEVLAVMEGQRQC